MRTIDDIAVGAKQTPLLLIISRIVFAALFVFSLVTLFIPVFPFSTLDLPWIWYLVAIYFIAEKIIGIFREKGIDLTFAFPLMFFVILLHMVSIWLDGQERFPLLNRAEHFTSYVLITYIVWVFFIQYLPQRVWRKHPYYTALLVFSVSSAFGSLNEVVELALESIFGSPLIGDKWDTSLDILMNSLGTGMFLAVRLILGAAEEEEKQRRKRTI